MTMHGLTETHPRVGASGNQVAGFDTLLPSVLDVGYRLAYCLTGSQVEAAELVEEAAVQASRQRDTGSAGVPFPAWFLGLLTQEFYSSGYAVSAGLEDWHPDPADGPSLEFLPVGERVVNALHMVGELTYQEIATVLDLPRSAVRARLHRGRARIRQTRPGS